MYSDAYNQWRKNQFLKAASSFGYEWRLKPLVLSISLYIINKRLRTGDNEKSTQDYSSTNDVCQREEITPY